MLTREIFVMAINKIQKYQALMEQLHQTLRDFGSLHLEALLAVLKEAMNDKYDYIGWWLYEAAELYLGKKMGKQSSEI